MLTLTDTIVYTKGHWNNYEDGWITDTSTRTGTAGPAACCPSSAGTSAPRSSGRKTYSLWDVLWVEGNLVVTANKVHLEYEVQGNDQVSWLHWGEGNPHTGALHNQASAQFVEVRPVGCWSVERCPLDWPRCLTEKNVSASLASARVSQSSPHLSRQLLHK